jgi:hypothetical protein
LLPFSARYVGLFSIKSSVIVRKSRKCTYHHIDGVIPVLFRTTMQRRLEAPLLQVRQDVFEHHHPAFTDPSPFLCRHHSAADNLLIFRSQPRKIVGHDRLKFRVIITSDQILP